LIRDKTFFNDLLCKQLKNNLSRKPGNDEYGNNVMPILKVINSLNTYEERMAFLEVIESFLDNSDVEKRRFAIQICLGSIVLKDAI
jgi:hypothetical protein